MKKWVKQSLVQAFLMLTALGIVFPLIDGTFSVKKLIIATPVFVALACFGATLCMEGTRLKKLQNHEKMGTIRISLGRHTLLYNYGSFSTF